MSMATVVERSPQAVTEKLEAAHQVLNHDFCPWANRWVYWMKHPLSVLGLLLITSIPCGIYVNQVAFGFATILLILGVLGVVWPWISMRGVDCLLEFDRTRCRVGQPVVIRIELRNRWPFPLWGLELKKGFMVNEDDPSGVALACLWGWSTREIRWHFEPRQRGLYPLHTPALETGFPFGLMRSHKDVAFNHDLLVWPQVHPLKGVPETLNQSQPDERYSDRQAGGAGDLLGTRDFRQGDSLRKIHWAQTARHGRLIVTERQASVGTVLRLLPDLRGEVHEINQHHSTLEMTIETVASIAALLHAEHQYAECLIDGKWYRAGKNEADYRQLMDALARLPAGGLTKDDATRQRHRLSGVTVIRVTTRRGAASGSERLQSGGELMIEGGDDDEVVWSQVSRQWRRLCHVA